LIIAAGLVDAAVKFFFRIQRETLPPLRLAATIPLAMDGYACMFGTTRIPGMPQEPSFSLPSPVSIVTFR
jgi:hypothetical protein